MVGHYSAIAHPHNSVLILKPPFSEKYSARERVFVGPKNPRTPEITNYESSAGPKDDPQPLERERR